MNPVCLSTRFNLELTFKGGCLLNQNNESLVVEFRATAASLICVGKEALVCGRGTFLLMPLRSHKAGNHLFYQQGCLFLVGPQNRSSINNC